MTNKNETTHRLSVTISFENSVLVDETVILSADESSSTAFENPGSAGSAVLEAELDTADRTRTEIQVGPGTGIRDVFVEISADGELTAFAGRT
jgi:hypothetical protein